MGLFSGNRFASYSYEDAQFLKEYATPDAAYRMMLESYVEYGKIFDEIISMDFQEAGAYGIPLTESQITVMYEGFLSDVWGKIKSILKKIKDKISSIVTAFITKLKMLCASNNKELVNNKEYKKAFLSADASKVKVKNWRAPNNNVKNLENKFDTYSNKFNEIYNLLTGSVSQENLDKINDDINIESLRGKIFGDNSEYTATEFKKEVIDNFLDDPELKDGFSNQEKNDITETLSTGDEAIKNLKKTEQSIQKSLKNIEKDCTNAEKDFVNADAKKGANVGYSANGNTGSAHINKDNQSLYVQGAHILLTLVNHFQTISAEFTAALIEMNKIHMAQCRRAFIAIASYREKKEGYIDDSYMSVIEEASDYEVESTFDEYTDITE